jgi:hypothetical protein
MEGYYSNAKYNERICRFHGFILESGIRVTRVIAVRGFSCVGTVTAVYIPSSFCKVSLDTSALSRSLVTNKSC